MSEVDFPRLETRVPGLDQLMRGGLPEGRATLVAGRSGTGKTILALQVAAAFARQGQRTTFVSTEENRRDLIATGDALGLELSQLLEDGSLEFVDLLQPMGGPVLVSGSFDIAGLISRLVYLVERFQSGFVVLDSISAVFSSTATGSHTVRHQFFQVVHAFTSRGLSSLITADAPSDYGPVALLGMEDHVCDVVLRLRNVVDGKRRRRSIEVHKFRRSGHLKGEFPAAITDNGLSVFPLDSDAELPVEAELAPRERFSTGIEGLDSMTGGGWLRDSIVLVRGPTGSGKTITAGTLAHAGAARGERVFYYGFEEPSALLVQNFEQLGLPFREHMQSGGLRVAARFPESTSPEDMIIELRSVLAEHEPTLIIIDSISAIQHVTSYENFRQFIIGITSALRRHGRSAFLTQAVSESADIDESAPYLSTLADAILQLGCDSSGEEILRSARVFKMRGSAHDLRRRELKLGADGITIVAPGAAER